MGNAIHLYIVIPVVVLSPIMGKKAFQINVDNTEADHSRYLRSDDIRRELRALMLERGQRPGIDTIKHHTFLAPL